MMIRVESFRGLRLTMAALALAAAAPLPAASPAASAEWSGTWANSPETMDGPMKACCMGPGTDVPLTAVARRTRDDFVTRRQQPGVLVVTNSSSCTPPGMPAMLVHPILFEFLFTAGRATMLFDDGEVRRIWLDGRKHPPEDELEYGYQGHSIGHWEKATLVVDTIGISPRADVFMANGVHVSRQMHVVERMTLLDANTLQIDTTLTDPAVFVSPYHYVLKYQKVPGSFEIGCAANNRDDGGKPVDLTPPL